MVFLLKRANGSAVVTAVSVGGTKVFVWVKPRSISSTWDLQMGLI